MTKSIFALGLAAVLAGACSQSSPQPAAGGGAALTTAPAAGTAAAPIAAPAATAPVEAAPGAPASAPAAQTQPNNAATALAPGSATSQTAPPPSPAAAASSAPAPAAAAPAVASAREVEPPPPPPPPAPKFRELTIPAGTTLSVKLTSSVGSTSQVEDRVSGALSQSVRVDGHTALPVGTALVGNVTAADESGRVKGKAMVSFRFTRLTVHEESHNVRLSSVNREAESSRKDDVKKGGLGAGAGAIVGGIIGGGKGAAIGATAGGAGAILGTKGKEVHLAAGDIVTTILQDPLTVTVPIEP